MTGDATRPDGRPRLAEPGLLGRRRDRALARGFREGANFLWRTAADAVAERLEDTLRDFPDGLIHGTGLAAVRAALPAKVGTRRLRQIDVSPAMAAAAGGKAHDDEVLPVEQGEADLVLSILMLHWADDPVGQLVQLRRALRPDGLMIAALLGGQTLSELRVALAEAEAEVTGGLSPRVAPMGEIRDLGALLQRAGYAMPVADSERLTATYESPLALMRDLRAMGETNILAERHRVPMRRAVLSRACDVYAERFARPDGRVPATFEIVYLTGWAPGPDQPEPKRPGSARARLADALGTVEVPTGEKPGG